MSTLPDAPCSVRSNSFGELKRTKENPAELGCFITSLHLHDSLTRIEESKGLSLNGFSEMCPRSRLVFGLTAEKQLQKLRRERKTCLFSAENLGAFRALI